MVKRTIAIWWIVGTVVMFAGGLAILFVALETGQGGALHGHTGVSAALLAASITVAAVGVILQLVAWTGAVFNTHLLADKRWFKVLLWVGLAGIVTSPFVVGALTWWGLMLAYLVGGPDGTLPTVASHPAAGTSIQAPAAQRPAEAAETTEDLRV
jgi:hypothetical protein